MRGGYISKIINYIACITDDPYLDKYPALREMRQKACSLKCPICGKEFKTHGALATHIQRGRCGAILYKKILQAYTEAKKHNKKIGEILNKLLLEEATIHV
jgi:uncharacterized C2H2 Zn-finger protein